MPFLCSGIRAKHHSNGSSMQHINYGALQYTVMMNMFFRMQMFLWGRKEHKKTRILCNSFRMLGYSRGNDVLWCGVGGSRGGMAAILRPTAAMNVLVHPPSPFSKFTLRMRGPWDPWRGYFWTCMGSSSKTWPWWPIHCSVSSPGSVGDWQLELLPSEMSMQPHF